MGHFLQFEEPDVWTYFPGGHFSHRWPEPIGLDLPASQGSQVLSSFFTSSPGGQIIVGLLVGTKDGDIEGYEVGFKVGVFEGTAVGSEELVGNGVCDGSCVGDGEGFKEGPSGTQSLSLECAVAFIPSSMITRPEGQLVHSLLSLGSS